MDSQLSKYSTEKSKRRRVGRQHHINYASNKETLGNGNRLKCSVGTSGW